MYGVHFTLQGKKTLVLLCRVCKFPWKRCHSLRTVAAWRGRCGILSSECSLHITMFIAKSVFSRSFHAQEKKKILVTRSLFRLYWLSPQTYFIRIATAYFIFAPIALHLRKPNANISSRYFDTVFHRPHQYFLIVLKVFFFLLRSLQNFTSNWRWIEICENVVLSKMDITMTTINKQNGNFPSIEIWCFSIYHTSE